MSSELEDISQEVEKISAKLESAKDDAKKILFSPPERTPEDLHRLDKSHKNQFGREYEPFLLVQFTMAL